MSGLLPLRAIPVGLLALFASLLVLSLIAVRDGEAGSAPLTLVVDSVNADEAAGGPFLTQCTAADGDCSLRGAIVRVNNNIADTPNTINFNMTNGFTISITKALPNVTGPVNISGLTQRTGGMFPAICFILLQEPCVHLDGQGSGQSGSGLVLQGGGSSVRGLTISRFGGSGIDLVSSNNVVAQNYLGTPDGTTDGGNFTGVSVLSGFENNVIGTGNVLSGNQAAGVFDAGVGTVIQGNLIGTTETGLAALPNGVGVAMAGADNTVIGGEGFLRNVISGNRDGIDFQPVSPPNRAEGARIEGNIIGLGVNGSTVVANTLFGIFVENANDVTIGGATPSERNIISGNDSSGIVVISNTPAMAAEDVGIFNNYIGTDTTGTLSRSNGGYGVLVDSSSNVTIGAPGMGNLISGNNDPSSGGIQIAAVAFSSTDNVIQGNLIGTDASGMTDLTNADGILLISLAPGLTVDDTLIGGDGDGEGNVITNGSSPSNVSFVDLGTASNIVAGNIIGLGADGLSELGILSGSGVSFFNSGGNTIGGSTEGAGNVISGHHTGITLNTFSDAENLVEGNYIGTDVTGLVVGGLGQVNGIDSVGRMRVRDNVVSGNEVGISSLDNGPIVEGNSIGLSADGTSLPNTSHGIQIKGGDGRGATIGGSGAASNHIAFNGEAGIHLSGINDGTVGVTITGNSIHDNNGLGIEIEPGSNADVSAPTLTGAEVGANTRIVGTFAGDPLTEYTFEFFRNESCDPSGFGEGETFIASEELTSNGAGDIAIDLKFATITTPGQFVTATATDPDGNTSEFSNCATVVEAPPTPTPDVTGSPTPVATTPGPSVTATPPPANLLGDADCDGDVDADDILAVLQDVGDIPPGACELADTDCDHRINEEDALRIAFHLADIPVDVPDDCRAIET